MTDQELDGRFKALEDRMEARSQALEDRLVKFMAREFETVRKEITALERRVGFLGDTVAHIQAQIGDLIKQNGARESEMGQIRGAQAGQQRAIEELDRRLRRVEERDGSDKKS